MKVLMSLIVNLASGLIGATAVILALKFNPKLLDTLSLSNQTEKSKVSSFMEEALPPNSDPFEQMEKMREKFWGQGGFGSNSFDSLFDGFDSINNLKGKSEITSREDANYIYYEIEADNLDKTSLNTKVENGYLTITGKVENSSSSNEEESAFQSSFSSTFQKTFPLPAEVDETKMETYAENKKIIVRFPKTNT